MGYRPTDLSLQVRLQPAEASKKILAAFEKSGGFRPEAARLLGITERTLDRWVRRLGLKNRVQLMYEAGVKRRGPLEHLPDGTWAKQGKAKQ